MIHLDPMMCKMIPKTEPAIAVSGSNQLVLLLERKNCTTSKTIEIVQTIKNAQIKYFLISIFYLGFFRVITRASSNSKRSSISTRPTSKVIITATVGGIIQCEKYFIQRAGSTIENTNEKQIKVNKITQLIIVLLFIYPPSL